MQAFHAIGGAGSSAAPPPTAISRHTPRFISSFTNAVPFFYFHHIVDAENALLTVEVIGPNLSFTFSHHRVKGLRGTSSIGVRLERKTSGFLALVRGDERHVVALAESGHGCGPLGDLLDAPLDSPILPNDVWARRTVHMASLLGLKLESPFDTGNRLPDTIVTSVVTGDPTTLREEMRGMFFGCHVEVKLAVYAVCAMLKEFAITTDFDNLTVTQLRRLRRVKWDDGTRPAFEIYFSRKECPRCAKLVDTLEKTTGFKITLCWKERLIKKVIAKQGHKPKSRGNVCGRRLPPPVATATPPSFIIDIEDDDDDDLGAPSTAGMTDDNTVDLTSDMDDNFRSPIDLTGGDTMLHSPLFFPGTRPEEEEDHGVDGLADTPAGQTPRVYHSTPIPTDDRHIPKPLPATPIADLLGFPLNTTEQTLLHRRVEAWSHPSATRHRSLDPRTLQLSRRRHMESPSLRSRPKRRLSPITRNSRLPPLDKRQRPPSDRRGVDRMRFPYSVTPIVNDAMAECSSSDESIPHGRAIKVIRDRARETIPGLNLSRSGPLSGKVDASARHLQRDAVTAPDPLDLGPAANFDGAQIQTGDPAPRSVPPPTPTQQIMPPKTPSRAIQVVGGCGLDSPALQVYLYGREATGSPDPF